MKPEPESMQIPYEVYQDLVNHLTLHASTDAWAKSCLERLQKRSLAIHDVQGARKTVASDN